MSNLCQHLYHYLNFSVSKRLFCGFSALYRGSSDLHRCSSDFRRGFCALRCGFPALRRFLFFLWIDFSAFLLISRNFVLISNQDR